ncbi:hypothetical protein [Agriterribacter sp.]|uniref:hypothetical protein n=1 Tax=Agriterribacter sp. TaxID=2821509 RepID=UPI002CC24CD8|nr:hypothetical protein [Agriterribacter sp.]HRP56703.1 hypothetical protein [Agriterribacter sp.]
MLIFPSPPLLGVREMGNVCPHHQPARLGHPRLNWVLLDEQMKIAKDAGGNIMAGGYSGADPVGDKWFSCIYLWCRNHKP